MTPSQDGQDTPSGSGPSEDQVRRLLAEVRVEGALPPDIAARLDRALSGLDGPSGSAGPGARGEQDEAVPAAVDLGARRRRRRAAALLAAAVAIVAVGLGANALRGPGQATSSSDSSSSAGGSADSARSGSSASGAAPGVGGDSDPAQASPSAGGGAASQEAAPPVAPPVDEPGPSSSATDRDGMARVPVVRADSFARDVRRLRAAPGVRSTGQLVGERSLGAGPAFVCTPPARYGVGRLLAVRYGGAAAVLAYRTPSRQSQTVDLLQCGTAQVLRSTTVPRR